MTRPTHDPARSDDARQADIVRQRRDRAQAEGRDAAAMNAALDAARRHPEAGPGGDALTIILIGVTAIAATVALVALLTWAGAAPGATP